MSLSFTQKQQVLTDHRRSESDTGSVEVQVALLSRDIEGLTAYCKERKQDLHSRKGLIAKVSQRRKLLRYLKRTDLPRYQALIQRLKLRESV